MHKHVTGVALRLWPVSRQLAPILISAGCLWLLHRQLGDQVLAGIGPAVARIEPLNWIGAILATAISFWALGRYDVVLHRHFGTRIPDGAAALSGAAAIAISQVLGFGALTGALARWRILPALSVAQAMKITLAVASTFLACLLILLGVADLALSAQLLPVGVSVGCILLFVAGLSACFFQPSISLGRHRLTLPSLPAMVRIAWLSALDTAMAAFALYWLMPSAPGLELVYPAYLCALLAALVSGTPGGVGPFEIVLIACLPAIPEADLLGAIVGFRLVYYALPAACAMLLLARPMGTTAVPWAPHRIPIQPAALAQGRRAELGVARQNGGTLLCAGRTRAVVVSTPQAEIALFDPVGDASPRLFSALVERARRVNRVALIYKCSARTAALARRCGWATLHVADEAVLTPTEFTPDGRQSRQLRRKLRQAVAAGVTISRPQARPLHTLAAIDARWQARNGGARGVTMGQYCPGYLSDQRLYMARHGAEIVGFITFHETRDELCLDLMRQTEQAPPGTMHMLVMAAIRDARAEGRTRLSLAALPRQLPEDARGVSRLVLRMTTAANGPGLTQFKRCFAPRREPLYALAPGWPALSLGLADLARAIRCPATSCTHEVHEEKAFAAPRQT